MSWLTKLIRTWANAMSELDLIRLVGAWGRPGLEEVWWQRHSSGSPDRRWCRLCWSSSSWDWAASAGTSGQSPREGWWGTHWLLLWPPHPEIYQQKKTLQNSPIYDEYQTWSGKVSALPWEQVQDYFNNTHISEFQVKLPLIWIRKNQGKGFPQDRHADLKLTYFAG